MTENEIMFTKSVIEGDIAKVKSILETDNSIVIDSCDVVGMTALLHAVNNNYIDIAKLLLDYRN